MVVEYSAVRTSCSLFVSTSIDVQQTGGRVPRCQDLMLAICLNKHWRLISRKNNKKPTTLDKEGRRGCVSSKSGYFGVLGFFQNRSRRKQHRAELKVRPIYGNNQAQKKSTRCWSCIKPKGGREMKNVPTRKFQMNTF